MPATRDEITKANNLESLQALAKKHNYSDKWVQSIHASREKFNKKENI